jgi:hypothetical protein
MADDGEIRFESRTTKVAVVLGEAAFATIKEQALAAGGKETGGILIGRYDSTGNAATVSEATSRPRDSKSGWSWFQRGASGLKDLLRKRWSGGDYYLGEWHSHPGAAPDPSGNDINEMRSISRDPTYDCPKPIMIIAGTPFGTVRLSASVFENGRLLALQRVLDEPKQQQGHKPRVLSAADAGSITTTAEFAKQVANDSDFHGSW